MNGIVGQMCGQIALLLWLAYPCPPDSPLCCARFGGAAAAVRVRVQGNGEASMAASI
jgi:hypothetical protein